MRKIRLVGMFIYIVLGYSCNGNDRLEIIPVKSDCTQSSMLGSWIGTSSSCISDSVICYGKITAFIDMDIFIINCDTSTLVSGENIYTGGCHGYFFEGSHGEVVRYDYVLNGTDSLRLWINCRSFSCEYLLKKDTPTSPRLTYAY